MNLEGKLAVVTGGGAGIGRSICLRLAADGARLAVLDIREAPAAETLELASNQRSELRTSSSTTRVRSAWTTCTASSP